MRYLRAIGVALIILLTVSCRTTTADRNVAHRLDALFGDLHRRNLFDGAVVVGDGHHVIWEKGFGFANAEQQVLFTPNTPADGASLAKTLTATLLIMLDADGLLDLDSSAQRLLPELPYPEIDHSRLHGAALRRQRPAAERPVQRRVRLRVITHPDRVVPARAEHDAPRARGHGASPFTIRLDPPARGALPAELVSGAQRHPC